MTEAQIQSKIIKKMEANGYYVIKLSKTNKNGLPDLLCLKQDEVPLFIEVKKPGGVISPLQIFRQKELIANGFKSIIIDNTYKI
jgi:hypothetical protein